MKVIHSIGNFKFGGIERLVVDLVNIQKNRKDFEVAISLKSFEGEFRKDFEKLGVKLINFNLISGYDFNLYKIMKMIKYFNSYDIIHLHSFNLAIVVSAVISNAKIVYTEHGNFGFGRENYFSDKISFLLRKLFFNIFKINICANSKFTLRYLNEYFNLGNIKPYLIYNGVKLNYKIDYVLRDNLKNKYNGNYIIGTTSRLAGFKRITRLISVFHDYLKINPNSMLVIVGDGVERKMLEKKAKKLKILSNIDFVGFQKEVATYQSIFDVCIFPSKNEPFGLVAVECFSMKKPVLVFDDGGGLCEIVRHFNFEDVCSSNNYMLNRISFYQKNNFMWLNKHDEELSFFSNKRMEKEYHKVYVKCVE